MYFDIYTYHWKQDIIARELLALIHQDKHLILDVLQEARLIEAD